MRNYIDYFTEIEDRFQQRRGSLLMLSPLDWALIETWREANVPLEAVLRGIDDAFEKHNAKIARAKGRSRKINGLAWTAQSVMQATEALVDAATGAPRETKKETQPDDGFEAESIARFLEANAAIIEAAKPEPGKAAKLEPGVAARLRQLAEEVRGGAQARLEDLDRILSVLEEKMFASLFAAAPESELVSLREQAARELAPHRGKIPAPQLRRIEQQFLFKRLLAAHGLPRLSLFYMTHE